MTNMKHQNTLKEEIIEIEALIEKWQPASDEETRWALDLLTLSLYRRKQLLSLISGVEAGN